VFLENKKAKGNRYIYLCCYQSHEVSHSGRKFVYGFGRLEVAIKNMYSWKKNFQSFPIELLELGCDRSDLEEWINTIETGRTKTGKVFKAVI
jgi:hypothetical protein